MLKKAVTAITVNTVLLMAFYNVSFAVEEATASGEVAAIRLDTLVMLLGIGAILVIGMVMILRDRTTES